MKGIGASPGIAIGKALVIKKQVRFVTGITLQTGSEVQQEIQEFEGAVRSAVDEIGAIKASLAEGEGGIEFLEIQIELLQDEQIREDVIGKIATGNKNANDAVIEVIEQAVETFRAMNDDYFSARAADVQDAGNRILRHLNGSLSMTTPVMEKNTIIIAEDLSPSDAITIDITKVSGIATQAGSRTSHAALIARAKGIPAVVGCGAGLHSINTNDPVIVDGTEGLVVVQPTQAVLDEYISRAAAFAKEAALLSYLKDVAATTTDGVSVKLLANISNADEMELSFSFGSEGIGLLRTEMFFMGRDDWPGEEEQFGFYREVALKAKGKPVIVRTLDIGGDKQLSYFNLPVEQNPFLGYRAIRISLDRKDIFIAQLRAILRASIFSDLRIMLPMISNVQEISRAKEILEEVKTDLAAAGIAFNAAIPLGIMVEIPSAAVTADILAKEVDFFSIGTNDLCQYTLAVDRMNERVKHLYDPFNPGVLRLIQFVIEQGNKHSIHTGMCGELAGDVSATLLLLGMGLREFSMSAASIPYVKNIILHNSVATAREICGKVMGMASSQDIVNYLQEVTKQ
jgi:phosphoenolpyruvate-protein phosphotransferase (PTS system enzyme I)